MFLRLFGVLGLVILPNVSTSLYETVVAQTAPATADPIALILQLGIGGAVALVLVFWQRDTAKQRDKAVEQLGQFADALTDMRASVDRSTSAHTASSEAMKQMTIVLQERPPTRALVNRLTEAVQTLESMGTDR